MSLAPKESSFFDILADIWTPPEFIITKTVNSGPAGFEQDKESIRNYFVIAMGKMDEGTRDRPNSDRRRLVTAGNR